MTGFVKLYSDILDSSVWGEPLATRIVWITMLAMADKNGVVSASSDGIARRAIVPLKAAEAALTILESPDPRSKSPEHDGRRIERIDGGYQILNYLKYRALQTEKQKATAERQRRFRESHPVTAALRNGDITPHNAPSRPKAKAKAKADTKEETTKTTTSAPDGSQSSKLLPYEQCEALRQKWESIGRSCEYPRFRKALKPLFVPVQRFTPEQIGKAIEGFDELAKADGPSKGSLWHLQRFVDHIGTYVEWGEMPGTDDKGMPTARGKAAMGLKP